MDEREQLLDLIVAVREQLKYYQELGVMDTVKLPFPDPAITEELLMPKKQTPKDDSTFSLFELDSPTSKPADLAVKKISRSLGLLTLAEVRAETGHCCGLCGQATQVVFGEGSPQAEVMFVGEGPGADEDATGRPFVGAAGRLLDKIIEAMRFKREQVYITNVVKCRPPDNRKPTYEEMGACEPFLFNEIEIIKPKIIVTLGATPMYSLLRIKDGITKIRGTFYDFNGIPVMPTFHPAFLLRDPSHKREVWEDMKQVLAKLQTLR